MSRPDMPETQDVSATDTDIVLPTPEPTKRLPAALEVGWYVALTIVFGIIALGGFAAAAAVLPASCSLCHATQADQLAEGGHTSIHCDACHVSPGPFGLVDNRLRVAAMVPAQLLVRSPSSVTIHNEACLQCHGDLLDETIAVGGIRMSHSAPEDEGWLCTSCHPGVGHVDGSVRSYGDYSMDTCLACHIQSAQNVSGCEICHISEGETRKEGASTAWRVAHGANWRTMHGMGDLDTCRACHGPGYCEACHTIEFPHPEGFLGLHGETAMESAAAADACTDCHQLATCNGCHGLQMPHPVDFLPTHSDLVETEGQDVCVRCHEQSNCDACHERHAHPGLTPDVLDKLRNRPVGSD